MRGMLLEYHFRPQGPSIRVYVSFTWSSLQIKPSGSGDDGDENTRILFRIQA